MILSRCPSRWLMVWPALLLLAHDMDVTPSITRIVSRPSYFVLTVSFLVYNVCAMCVQLETKNHWARDDPAFAVLQALFLVVSPFSVMLLLHVFLHQSCHATRFSMTMNKGLSNRTHRTRFLPPPIPPRRLPEWSFDDQKLVGDTNDKIIKIWSWAIYLLLETYVHGKITALHTAC